MKKTKQQEGFPKKKRGEGVRNAGAPLVQDKENFNSLFNTFPLAVYIHDTEGKFIDVNDAACAMYGYAREDIIGRTPEFLSAPGKNDLVAMRAQMQKAMDGEPQQLEFWGKRKNGEIFPKDVRLHKGTYSGRDVLIAIGSDITDGKRAEQALRESEERYSALFSNNYSVSLLIDPDTGMIVDANDAAARYYGYARDRLLSLKISDLNRLPDKKIVRDLKRAKSEGKKHFSSTHYRADGEKRSVEIYSGPITVQGKPLFYSIIHDITDRKQVEQALRESEERYRTLIDQIPDWVIVHRNGILLYVNPSAAATLGYVGDELIGKSITRYITPEHHEAVKRMMMMRMAGKEVKSYEMDILAQDGTRHTVLVNGALIQYIGEPASLNVLTDITPIKAAEETIRRANEALEKRVAERTEALTKANVQMEEEITARKKAEREISLSLEEKELLLREIHHRVKNNLQIIISLLNLQSRHIHDPNVFDAIQDSQNRVRAMALVHERIYRSQNIATINLKDYISFLVNQIFGFYSIQHSQIRVAITMEEYPADIDMAIPIGLIMNELVSNSIKHAFPDGRKGEISIGCTQPAWDTLQFVYRDNGAGFPEGFDWKNTDSLGLRLVNSLVDQLGGTIEKEPGEGTMFIITLHRKITEGSAT